MSGDKLSFASDYMEGAHPDILKKLIETNMIKSPGYGADPYSESARNKIRKACRAEEAEVRFLIGGTKCGALFGEAVVISGKNTIPHFFTIIKQRGALLAKGRIAGIQFDTLFENGLYEKLGQNAVQKADRIRSCLRDKGYTFYFESPTNQIFLKLPKEDYVKMKELVEMSFWENVVENGKEFVVVRIATSWATSDEDVDQLRDLLDSL